MRGKFRKFIQQIRDILRLRLSRCRFVVEAVERVEDEDAATTADNEFAGFGKHTVGGGIAFQGDMGDVLGEKLLGACQQSLRHAAAVLETVSGEFLNQFAEMIDDRDVLRTEEANLPLMSQAETQYQFVHPFRFSRAGRSGDDDVAAAFVGTDFVHFLPPRFGTGTEAVVEKSPQVAVQVGSGENAFEGNFHRLFDSDAETFEAIFDEMFIGVLAVRPVGDHAATLGTEAVDKFVAQADSGGIGVDGDDDFFQVLEVGFHETVEP